MHGDCSPDLTLLFDVPTQVSRERLERTGRPPDKFEREHAAFFDRVRDAYLDRARAEPHRLRVIDSTQPIDAVRNAIARALEVLG